MDWDLLPSAPSAAFDELRKACPTALVVVLISHLDARSQVDALTNLLKNYRNANGQPLDPTKLNLKDLQGKGALPDGLGQGFTLYVNAITQAPVPDAAVTLALGDTVDEAMNTI